jgi:hypothetical protein
VLGLHGERGGKEKQRGAHGLSGQYDTEAEAGSGLFGRGCGADGEARLGFAGGAEDGFIAGREAGEDFDFVWIAAAGFEKGGFEPAGADAEGGPGAAGPVNGARFNGRRSVHLGLKLIF